MEIVKRLAKGHICKPIDTDNSVMMTQREGDRLGREGKWGTSVVIVSTMKMKLKND